jgi:ATP-dependent RNA helicase DDX47/RRP3
MPSEASSSRSGSPNTALDGSESERETTYFGPVGKSTSPTTFDSLGVISPLLTALAQLKFTAPTEIQVGAIPPALEGRDIIGVAETVGDFIPFRQILY